MKNQHRSVWSKRIVFQLLLMLVVLAAQGESFALDIYVSVDGGAQADGSLSKPYGSLPAAVEAVRALRKAGNTEPVVITLREGRHQLNQTLVLGMADGSPSDSKAVTLSKYGAGESSGPAYLTFAAYPGENPVVSAGVPVTGWKRLASESAELPAKAVGKVWVVDIPTGLERFYTLYDAQGRLNRARGDGFLPTKNGNGRTLNFPEGAVKNWDNLEDVEIQVRPGVAYEINMLPLESVDEESRVAKTRVGAAGRMGSLPPYLLELMGDKAASVWVENILEELDEPGEWVVNTKTRKIYLWPSDPAANGSPSGILAPTTTELIRVEGVVDYDGPTDTPVRGIAFSGLTFSHADRWAWKSNEEVAGWGLQHAWDMFDKPTALLRFRGAEECRVTDCRFVHSGGTGLRLDLHAQRNRIVDSEFAHLGEAGILLVGYGLGSKDTNHHNDIINNYIHHFSEITWQSPGFWAWQSGHNRIAHNEFSHGGYCSVVISTRSAGGKTRPPGVAQGNEGRGQGGNRRRGGYEGWKLREKNMHSRHNLFEYNEISHSVQLLSDGNGIYISGTGTGNIIRYNYLHDNLSHSLPAAIRCDDDQHETLIYGNVLYNNAGHAAGIASKGVNDIINNFIVAPTRVPRNGYVSFEWAPVTGSKVERNIIISHPDGGKAQSERLRRGQTTVGPKLESTEMDKNLYYHPTDSHWMDEHLLKMRAAGKEKASLFGDPMFKDPIAGDFSFRPGSPALALGIEPLDVSKMGRLDDRSLVYQLRPDGVTAIIASRGALSGNAKRHFRSGNVVHGFSSPQDTVTWTVMAPKDDDYVVDVLYSKREQANLEVSSGDSVLTAPSIIRTWDYRPFFWRQELPGTLPLKAGKNLITFRVPDAKPTAAFEGNRVRRSPRFGQGVTEEFHLFSIELGTAAARKAEVQRAQAIRGDASWMVDGKYGIFVHWSSQSRGFNIGEKRAQWFQKSVEMFDVKVFADAIERTGAGWVTFTATHQGFYWPGPSAAIDKIATGRTAKRDLLGEIINELDKRGIRTLFYLHTGYNGYDPKVWRQALGANDADTQRFSDNIEAILRECSLRYGEKLMGFGYMDGALAWDYPLNPSWEGWARAIKAGNPKAVVGFSTNRGPMVSPFSELAVTDGGSELRQPDLQLLGPGQQLGDVSPAWWCLMDQGGWFQNRPMNGRYSGGPIHSTEAYVAFFKRMAEAKIPVTINLILTADVTDEHPIFNPKCMAVMEDVRKAVHGK